jgi:hypothetical protein
VKIIGQELAWQEVVVMLQEDEVDEDQAGKARISVIDAFI